MGLIGIRAMDFTNASYEVQLDELNRTERRMYPVRVTSVHPGCWYLQAQTHLYRPYLRYWAMTTVPDTRDPKNDNGVSTWTLWFIFREAPMEHLNKIHHDGLVMFLRDDIGPHHLFVPGFTADLFVGPGGTIARAEILRP